MSTILSLISSMVSTRHFLLSTLVLVGVILFFGLTSVDMWVQEHWYHDHHWYLSESDTTLKWIFYDGIKRLIILLSVGWLLYLVIRWKHLDPDARRDWLIVVLSMILIPSIVGLLKAYTNMPCPHDIIAFGGAYPHTAVWESYTPSSKCLNHQKCWPAGHASGGFALLSWVIVAKHHKGKIAVGVLILGWSMGTYKMLVGDHFLSHTMITMVLAWWLSLGIALGINWAMRGKF